MQSTRHQDLTHTTTAFVTVLARKTVQALEGFRGLHEPAKPLRASTANVCEAANARAFCLADLTLESTSISRISSLFAVLHA